MCGICGIVQTGNSKIRPVKIKEMAGRMKHRGPDDEGYIAAADGEVFCLGGEDSQVFLPDINSYCGKARMYLGHRRLSIIDLTAAGHQPMCYRGEDVWLVYNGEIYNYLKLRDQLSDLGYRFTTRTDSEVLLASYLEWGEACLEKLDGMWSFVIFDNRKNILFGSRDRFGVKPFYYLINDSVFAFASEIKAFLPLNCFDKKVRDEAVFDYLAFGLERWAGGTTFFKDIYELPPACAFRFNLKDNSFSKYQYYKLPFNDEKRLTSFDSRQGTEHVSLVRNKVFNAIRSHLVADVPVGTCLSGGIDSSSIVGAINVILQNERIAEVGETPRVLTACYDNHAVDESKWAQLVVEQTGAEWHKVYPNEVELMEDIADLVYTQEYPFGSTSIYAQYKVMKLAGQLGVKVLLDGQGGDELFTGYPPFHAAFIQDMLNTLAVKDLYRELKHFHNTPMRIKDLLKRLLVNYAKYVMPAPIKKYAYKKHNNLIKYISPEMISNFYTPRFEKFFEMFAVRESLNKTLNSFMTAQTLPGLLRYEDRNSMRFSIESRTPFADDRDLIETTFSIPAVYKIHNGYSKWLLREALKPELPASIYARRDKIGFATPETDWLSKNKDLLVDNDFLSFDYLQKDIIIKDWDLLVNSQSKSNISQLWRAINLGLWQQVFIKGNR